MSRTVMVIGVRELVVAVSFCGFGGSFRPSTVTRTVARAVAPAASRTV
ncbi:MAG: hypothetical protein RML45_11685 [Acetobacteraceae bacterium]|nr:hypothetical protein [Acetobacteraceae bacterium]